jgi:hypothetical protein
MNRYEPRTPRAVFGFAAVFLTAATLAVSVVAPAAMDVGSREVTVLTQTLDAQAKAAANAPTTSIDVIAVRATRVVPAVPSPASKIGLQG